jgi:hypothetical protein
VEDHKYVTTLSRNKDLCSVVLSCINRFRAFEVSFEVHVADNIWQVVKTKVDSSVCHAYIVTENILHFLALVKVTPRKIIDRHAAVVDNGNLIIVTSR